MQFIKILFTSLILVWFSASSITANGGNSEKSWIKVLRTGKSGNILFGAKADLRQAVMNGLRIKFATSDFYTAEISNCQLINDDLCCQALLHVSYKGNWETFQSNSYWWMVNVCTTGHWHMVRYKIGGGFLSETKTTEDITWFVLRNKNGSYPVPVLSTNAAGKILSGSKEQLRRAIKQGKSVRIVDNKTLFPIQNVQLYSDDLSAQHLWSVSQTRRVNHIEFQSNAYWFFVLFTPSGTRDMSRWNLGAHTSRGHTKAVVPLKWFVDENWRKIEPAGCQCSEAGGQGNLTYLVESGHRVKIEYNKTFIEADNIKTFDGGISVQLVSQLARRNARTFQESLNWEFRTLATSGTVRLYQPLVGDASGITNPMTHTDMDIGWFVDCTEWKMLFHMSISGDVVSGSAQSVLEAASRGVDIRVGYKLNGDSGFRYATADNVGRGTNPNVHVQLVRLLRDRPVQNDGYELDEKPVWSFTRVSTDGFVRTTEWIVGKPFNDGECKARAEVKWFAKY